MDVECLPGHVFGVGQDTVDNVADGSAQCSLSISLYLSLSLSLSLPLSLYIYISVSVSSSLAGWLSCGGGRDTATLSHTTY